MRLDMVIDHIIYAHPVPISKKEVKVCIDKMCKDVPEYISIGESVNTILKIDRSIPVKGIIDKLKAALKRNQ